RAEPRLAPTEVVTDARLRHTAPQRDPTQREPDEPVSPRALQVMAVPDAQRLEPRGHDAVPEDAEAMGAGARRAHRTAAAVGTSQLLRSYFRSVPGIYEGSAS